MKCRKLNLLTLLGISLALIASKGYWSTYLIAYALPYYNHYFTKFEYQYPEQGEEFVVHNEPYDNSEPPWIVQKVLKRAFYDRKVVFDNSKKPHFVTRSEHISMYANFSKEYQKYNVPYIGYSGERWPLPKKRYRRNGLPIAEFVSKTSNTRNHLYFPFIAYCGLKPERYYEHGHRNKLVAYIASNCTKTRDNFFSLLKQADNSAEALGKCLNPNPENRAKGGWGQLSSIYANYNFAFAMENHQIPGYITEKILAVYNGGAIPLYWGDSKLVEQYFNPESYIDIGKFNNLTEAADYIINLSNYPEKMEKIRRAPIFKDNLVPDIFQLNEENGPSQIIDDAAKFIREEYFALLKGNHT